VRIKLNENCEVNGLGIIQYATNNALDFLDLAGGEFWQEIYGEGCLCFGPVLLQAGSVGEILWLQWHAMFLSQ
jgi:hypothetical protein